MLRKTRHNAGERMYSLLVVSEDAALLQKSVQECSSPRREMYSAETAERALKLLQERDFDCILLLQADSGPSAPDFVRQASALRPKTPVLVLSPDSETLSDLLPGSDGSGPQRTDQSARPPSAASLNIEAFTAQEKLTRFLQSVLDAVPIPLYVQDDEGSFLYINKAFASLYGMNRRELAGLTAEELFPAEEATKFTLNDPCALDDSFRVQRDLILNPPNGPKREAVLHAACLRDGDKKCLGRVGALFDVTETRQKEKALHEALSTAEEAFRAKSDFMAFISHEIRNPVTSILGMADLLYNSPLTPEQKRYVRIFRNAGENLLEIINDLLDLSKAESGRLELESSNFSLREAVEQSCDTLVLRAHEKNLELTYHIAGDIPDKLQGDPLRLRQILMNLAGNAVKFTKEGEVRIKVEPHALPLHPGAAAFADPVRLLFSVRDTGLGIAKDKREVVFEQYAQADAAITRKYGGTGLGLAICRELAEMMNGEIWVDSEPGRGSTFWFTAEFTSAPDQEHALFPESVRRVLIIDDNASSRRMLQEMAVFLGAVSQEAHDGPTGLQLIQKSLEDGGPFDLILLDAGMSPMDGFETAKALQRLGADIGSVVMLLASKNTDRFISAALEIGLHRFLDKPVKLSELAAVAAEQPEADGYLAHGRHETDTSADQIPEAAEVLLAAVDKEIQEPIINLFKSLPYRLIVTATGAAAFEHYQAGRFRLLIVQHDLPDMHGEDVLRKVREKEEFYDTRRTPALAVVPGRAEAIQACVSAGFTHFVAAPLVQAELEGVLAHYAPPEGRGLRKESRFEELNYLIVDDSYVMRMIITRVISEIGYKAVYEADHGMAALGILNNHDIHFVICDWNMPRMKGIDLLEKMREDSKYKDVPFIMLTAEGLDVYKNRAVRSGVTRYVTKPFRPEDLKQVIEEILSRNRQETD